MLTRRNLRRALLLTGMSLGALGPLVALFTLFGSVIYRGPHRDFMISRGAIVLRAYPGARTKNVMSGNSVNMVPIDHEWTLGRRTGRPWYWMPIMRASTAMDDPSRLTIPWWLLTAIGLVSLYFYLPPGYAKGHCQRCNFDLANLPPDPENPSKRRCPECGHLSPVRA